MGISSLQLDAFLALAKSSNFSIAAKFIHITQSALSQRIKNLEDDLGLTLFIRTPAGAILTEQGERLLRYCQTRDLLEEELLSELNIGKSTELSGVIRIATYSSVLRSVIIPSLNPLLEKNSQVLCSFVSSKINELLGRLQRAEVDFIITDTKIEKSNLSSIVLGQEKFVLIESTKESARNDIYLDNDANDQATELFLRAQGEKQKKYRRSYFDDCYGIIDGVERGLGRAVMPQHLIQKNNKIKTIKTPKQYKTDVVLHYYQQPFYSKLHQAAIDCLTKNVRNFL